MISKKTNKNNDLISRFSSSLLGNGRKQSGHKIFLESLFLVRGNDEKRSSFLKSVIGNSKEKTQEREEGKHNLFKFLLETGLSIKTLQNGIKRWNDLQEKEGDSKRIIQYNNYKNISLSNTKKISLGLSNDKEVPVFDRKESSTGWKTTTYKEVPLTKKRNHFSFRDLSKISDTTKNKDTLLPPRSGGVAEDLQRKGSSDLEYLNKTILQLSNKRFLDICKDNVKPIIETRNVRKGRVTYKVPLVTQSERQEGKAISWLIDNASFRKKGKEGSSFHYADLDLLKDNIFLNKAMDDRKNNHRSIKFCLASLLSDSFICKGESVEKRKEFHKIALKNRSYTSYRWW